MRLFQPPTTTRMQSSVVAERILLYTMLQQAEGGLRYRLVQFRHSLLLNFTLLIKGYATCREGTHTVARSAPR